MDWMNLKAISPRSFECGYCANKVGADRGWHTNQLPPSSLSIYVCPLCSKPTTFADGKQFPGVAPGSAVASLPADVEALYTESRRAVAAGAFTASVLACRKLLMNVAVSQGAPPGQSFVNYVDHLSRSGYIPPNGRGWVDHIRRKGNEATHEIHLMTAADANELIVFAEMLLKFVFEFPSRVPPHP